MSQRPPRPQVIGALLRVLGGLALVLAGTLACRLSQEPEDVGAGELCDEIGYSISNRTLACSGDASLAKKRFDDFGGQYTCPEVSPSAPGAAGAFDAPLSQPQLDCAGALFALPCEQVAAFGDNLEAWLASQPPCLGALVSKTGKALDPPCQTGLTRCGGVCQNLPTSVASCGACGNACPAPGAELHQVALCHQGQCALGCSPPFADCNGDPADGCESSLSDDPANCGGCGVACAAGADNTVGSCAGQRCQIDCQEGFLDCDGDITQNGCETPSDLKNCYQCGADCSGGGQLEGACDAASRGCVLIDTCGPDALNCDLDVPGCETPQSAEQCGSCGTPCPTAEHSTPQCAGGVCALTCDEGFLDCDLGPANGCESAAADHPDCSTCPGLCPPPPPHMKRTCIAAACGFECNQIWRDCNNDLSDGCEHNGLSCP